MDHYHTTGTKIELNSKPPTKEILNVKEGTVIRRFVMNLIKLRKGHVGSADKGTATLSIQIKKGETPIHLSPIEEELRSVYSSNSPAHSMLSE